MAKDPLNIKKYDPFLHPIDRPESEPDEGDTVCIVLSQNWIPAIIAALWPLTYTDKWKGTTAERITATGQATNLIGMFQAATICIEGEMIRQNPENPCYIQTSSDGGITWQNVINMALCNGCLPVFSWDGTTLKIDSNCDGIFELQQNLQGLPGADGAPGLPGADGLDGASPEMRVFENFIQWRQDDDSPTWTNLVALADLKGADGLPGADGAPGLPGADGQDGADGAPGQPGGGIAPEVPPAPGNDKYAQACAISEGLAVWLISKCISSINIIKASSLAAKDIADQVTDLLDAIPIFGSLINNLIDLAADMATKGDFDDIIGFMQSPDFKDQVQCQLYCYFKGQNGNYTVDSVWAGIDALAQWAWQLTPGMPLLTLYGQAFCLFLEALDPPTIHKRAFVHKDERSDDCYILCFECVDATVSFAAASSSATEGSAHSLNVKLSVPGGAGLPGDVIVNIGVSSGTATQGTDYSLNTTQVTFLAGSQDGATQTVQCTIMQDNDVEPDEYFILTLGAITGDATPAEPSSHVVTIQGNTCTQYQTVTINWNTPTWTIGTPHRWSAGTPIGQFDSIRTVDGEYEYTFAATRRIHTIDLLTSGDSSGSWESCDLYIDGENQGAPDRIVSGFWRWDFPDFKTGQILKFVGTQWVTDNISNMRQMKVEECLS